MSKNNRYRIVVENKTSPSHRMKKMTIVEAYWAGINIISQLSVDGLD
jgi:hypothetical protein